MTVRMHVRGRRRAWIALSVTAALNVMITAAATAQTIGRADDDGISVWRVIAAFVLCAMLAVGAALILRARMGYLPQLGVRRARRLHLIETLRLGRQVSLSIVACDGEEMLLLSSDQAGQFIRRLPAGGTGPEIPENVP